MKNLVLILILMLCGVCWGADYYVDATGGLDANAGTSTSTAWQTLNKVNTTVFSAGDNIHFKRGEVWRGMIEVEESGTAAARLTYADYGTGDKPIIKGSIVADEVFQVPAEGEIDSDDLESGSADLTFWDSFAAQISVDTYANLGIAGPTGGGTYGAMASTNSAATAMYVSDIDYANLWIELDVRSPAVLGDNYFLGIYDEDGTLTHTLRWANIAGAQRLRFFKEGGSGVNSTNTFSQATWYTVKIQFISDIWSGGETGLVRIWVDGTKEVDIDKASSVVGISGKKIDKFGIGANGKGQSEVQYFDNVRYSRADFDSGIGLYAQGVYPFSHGTDDNQLKMWVDGTAYTGPEAALANVDAAGEFIIGDGDPIADTNYTYYWYSDYTSNTVELPFQYNDGESSYYTTVINITDESFITLKNLDLRHARSDNIYLQGSDAGDVFNVRVENCDISESIYAGTSITKDVRYLTIDSCTYRGCEHSAIYTNLADSSSRVPRNITITNNDIQDCQLEGIYLEKIDGALIQGNLIANTTADSTGTWGRALMVTASGTDQLTGVVGIYNNTIYASESYCLQLDDAGSTGEGYIDFKNNIVVQTSAGIDLAFTSLAATSKILQLDYNCYWHTSNDTDLIWNFASTDDFNRTELSAYQTATGQGANSLFVNPQLDSNYKATNPQVLKGGKPDVYGNATSIGAYTQSGTTDPFGRSVYSERKSIYGAN